MVLFAASNFLGPLLLGRLFDTVGRIPMIAGTYLGSAAVVVALGLMLRSGTLDRWSFMAFVLVAFFLASSGASAAYLTVSEIFPLELRAQAIALFFAIAQVFGSLGPTIFGLLIGDQRHPDRSRLFVAYLVTAGVMAVAGVVAALWGVRAERTALEDVAAPLSEVRRGGPDGPK